jgi:hypothetical protein
MKKNYLYTNQKDLRKAFKEMIIELEGLEAWKEMSATTKRCAFNEWKNELQRNGDISENLRCRACFD